MSAAAMWRPTTAAAINSPAVNAAAVNSAALLNQLHAQKQYVVTTPGAGRDNKGTSPWGFPV